MSDETKAATVSDTGAGEIDELSINTIRTLAMDAVQKAKPSGAKGTFVKRVSVASTQGPGVKIDPSTLAAG